MDVCARRAWRCLGVTTRARRPRSWDGTSMAAPHISALAAMLVSFAVDKTPSR
ncbi:MAG: S8 family serine peptidase [Lachnospiraceae bacterium]